MSKLAHHVYFTMKDRGDASVQHQLAECEKYLSGHEGCVHFSLGVRDKSLDREVNGDFDVSLHLVFADGASQDKYQVSERHQTFIAENKGNWANTIVYDSTIVAE